MSDVRRPEPDFRTLFESAPGLYLVLEPDAPRYTIVAVSDAYARATMTKREHLLGRGLFEIFPDNPDDPSATDARNLAASLERVIGRRAPDTMAVQKYDIRRSEEEGGGFEERWWSPVNSPVFGPNGEIIYIIHRLEDVTQFTRQLFECMPVGIFVAAPDGRYTDVNAAGCNMLGYSRDELLGLSIRDLVSPSELERQASLKRHLLEGGVEISEWLLKRKDGSYVPVELSAAALPDGRLVGVTRDITKRLAAEADLKRSEQEFRSLAESMPQIVWATDVDGLNTYFNQQWVDYTGLTLQESYGEGWVIPFHPDDRQRAWDAWKRATQYRDTYSLECRLRRADGVYQWWLIRGVPLLGANGEILKWFGTCTDIEHIKIAEQRLKESQAMYSGIVSISADAIISIDELQRITMFNEGAQKIFGYSKEEAVGAPLDVLLPERFRAIHRQHVERFAAGEGAARRMGERGSKILGLRKNGEEFPADAAISKLEVGGKRILTVALRDVTEQRRIENQQRFLAELGSVLVSTLDYEETPKNVARLVAGDLADFCIVETVEERRQVHRHTVAHREPGKAVVAHNLQEIQLDPQRPYLGSSVFETKRPLLLPEVTPEYLASIAQSEEHRQVLLELNPKSLMMVPLLGHGQVVGSMVFISTTARRYAQEDLFLAEQIALRAALAVESARLYQTAQRAVQARDDVLGVVAHDLRTPLGSILMQANLLRRPRGAEPERRSRKPAEVIERAATRMNRLIQDLLEVMRMEAGRLTVERGRVPAGLVVSDSVEAQKPLASQSSLDLLLDLPPDLPEVWADRDRLLQVFENLIGNAIKFTAPEGRIVVGAAPRDGEVLFWVTDTGSGIATEDLPHVFDRFWQARKAGRRGAGLGLPIVKGIVEAHGGRVWVESAPGRGSTFFFTTPTASLAEAQRSEAAPHGP